MVFSRSEFKRLIKPNILQVASLRRALLNFMQSALTAVTSDRNSSALKEVNLQRWIRMFFERAQDRRWTIAGDHGIMYIPPHSRALLFRYEIAEY